MRMLHVGYGFRPWIVNGLVVHSETVMDGQVREGHQVGYFFPGRQLPLVRRPFVHRWQRRGVQMFELVSSDLVTGRHDGTASPESELHHPPSERAFTQVLRRFNPDLVHVHDLGGLPSSLLELARSEGLPVVLTIHDYHSLCPTVKLYDANRRVCLRPDPGAMCSVCCRDAPVDASAEVTRTVVYLAQQLRERSRVGEAVLRNARVYRLAEGGLRLLQRSARATHGVRSANGHPAPERPRASAQAYQRRRDVNVERLNRVSALIASSRRSAEIYRQLGVTDARIEILPINPPHIQRLQPRRRRSIGRPLRFIVLNACSSTQKGAELVTAALANLTARGFDDHYRLSVYGPVADHVLSALLDHPSVELHGDYETAQLDRILEQGDVGLLPSVWEEVYGYVGLEYLAKGIPVIGNAIGAIPDYVRPEQTGWLNRSSSADELAKLMVCAIENPAEVSRLGETAAALRDELIEPFESALARLTGLYHELTIPGSR